MTNDVIGILRKQMQMANESNNEISDGYKSYAAYNRCINWCIP